jgi:predicted AAA+ superfamily ATPase
LIYERLWFKIGLIFERLRFVLQFFAREANLKRLIDDELVAWKNASRRKPLILRGARQVGKTFSVETLGRGHFDNVVRVDLERNRDWHRLFASSLSPGHILPQLELLADARIIPEKTLLFFDEIQSCPSALMALRYFYEELPGLHVVAAGSLLDFAMSEISFPVGRVQFLEMHPMTFAEYLWAAGKEAAAEVVLAPPKKLDDTVHRILLDELRRYFFTGGMPESVSAFVHSGSLRDSFAVQRELAESYRQDFSKYAPRADARCLDAVFKGAAQGIGRQVQYTRLAEGYSHPTIKRAFDLLCMARVIQKVPAADPSGLPLGATASSRRFKALMVDVGLWQSICGLKTDTEYARGDLLDIYRGAMAEQFVGQEIRAAQGPDLYYWSREARGSAAEVDFLAVVDKTIHPVEVKSGASGRLRSLHQILRTCHDCGVGFVFSQAPYAELSEQKVKFLPLYFAYSATKDRSMPP